MSPTQNALPRHPVQEHWREVSDGLTKTAPAMRGPLACRGPQRDGLPPAPGYPGLDVLSPGRPLGDAPVPIEPGVEVFGTPGWLTPLVLLPVVAPGAGVMAGGVAGETPGEPAAVPPGDEGGAAPWAAAARVEPARAAAANVVRNHLRRMKTSQVL